MAEKRVTRSCTEDELFGQHSATLPDNQLALKIEIIQYFLHRKELECDRYMRGKTEVKTLKSAKKTNIIKDISAHLSKVWSEKANIPIKSQKSIGKIK